MLPVYRLIAWYWWMTLFRYLDPQIASGVNECAKVFVNNLGELADKGEDIEIRGWVSNVTEIWQHPYANLALLQVTIWLCFFNWKLQFCTHLSKYTSYIQLCLQRLPCWNAINVFVGYWSQFKTTASYTISKPYFKNFHSNYKLAEDIN